MVFHWQLITYKQAFLTDTGSKNTANSRLEKLEANEHKIRVDPLRKNC